MERVDFVVWSKDRACQLYLLLESMEHIKGCRSRVTVLYKASNEDFQNGYSEVKKEFPDVFFVEERNFLLDSITILNNIPSKYVCLLTDDTVFFAEGNLEQPLEFLSQADSNVFSMRLGYNTIVQDHIRGINQRELRPEYSLKGFPKWSPKVYPPNCNYGYPFAIDAHIYNQEFLVRRVNTFNWSNTNALEGGLQKFTRDVNLLGCFEHSIAVNIPFNCISGLTGVNPVNNGTLESMNRTFLSEFKISLDVIEREKIVGCHQDVPLKWTSRD